MKRIFMLLIRIDRDPIFILESALEALEKRNLIIFRFDALGGSADALPPPRGHPPQCDDDVLPAT
jgi:hypothetical protein